MTSRPTTLIFIALVVLASLAGADTPTNGVPETASLTAPAAPAEASAACNPLLATLGISPLDSANRASDYPDCGICSESACRGLEIYSFCGGTLTKPKRCKTSGYMCLEDPRVRCLCADWTTA